MAAATMAMVVSAAPVIVAVFAVPIAAVIVPGVVIRAVVRPAAMARVVVSAVVAGVRMEAQRLQTEPRPKVSGMGGRRRQRKDTGDDDAAVSYISQGHGAIFP